MTTRNVLVAVAMTFACAPKSAETEGDSGSSAAETSGGEVTSASDTAPTTSAGSMSAGPTTTPPTSSSAEGSASATATATSTSASTSTSTDTGDETAGGAGLPGACAAVCMHWDMCSPGSAGPVAECAKTCVAGFEVPSECAMATADMWSCVAGLSCEEALKFLGGSGPPTSCQAEVAEADAVCHDSPGCGGEISGGDDFCELEQQCSDDLTQNYHCDIAANLCTCTENDVPGKQCPADGFCGMGSDEQRAAITACCGWVWK